MINLDKEKLLKYGEFLKESLDPWKLKVGIKSFNRLPEEKLAIHGDLKNLSSELTKELLNVTLPYSKLLSFGGIEIDLIIKKSRDYYSNIDWIKFLNGDYEIVIDVVEDYDINYVVSMIIHEIRHMIDFSDENLNSGLSSFDIDRNLRKYNIDIFREFFTLVYISLEHELVARNNQIYPYIKFKNLTKEESLEILKSSFIWKSIQMLRNFDYKNFVFKFNESDLMNITNGFIRDCLYDNGSSVESREDLLNFYRIWDEYFREVSEKWENLIFREVDMVYERKVSFHHTDYKQFINRIWNKLVNI